MIARLSLLLPFSVDVPEGETFNVHEYMEQGYRVRVFPPTKSDSPITAGTADELTIDGRPAFSANGLRIDFHKSEFDRRSGADCDPSHEFIQNVVSSFVARLRYVTRAAQVHQFDLGAASWRIQYLKDDETELVQADGLVRGRVTRSFSWHCVALSAAVWDSIHELPPDFVSPTWHDLLLDAHAALPEIGPALVLGASALEVFVGRLLDDLAQHSAVPAELWTWINERPLHQRPSTAEQFDELLKILCGYSLKDDETLWKGFKNLRAARNSFCHQGVARVGQTLVTVAETGRLLGNAVEIVRVIREHLPETCRWKVYEHKMKIQALKYLVGGPPEDTKQQ